MDEDILLVDDEKDIMKYYVRALKSSGFNVKHICTTDEALKYLQEDHSELKLGIVDIMMPPGNAFQNKDTNYGLRTGFFMYKALHERYPNLPVIILTNVTNQETIEVFQQDPELRVLQKLVVPPSELAKTVKRMVGSKTNEIV